MKQLASSPRFWRRSISATNIRLFAFDVFDWRWCSDLAYQRRGLYIAPVRHLQDGVVFEGRGRGAYASGVLCIPKVMQRKLYEMQ
jgi:hypothetical protein